MNSKVGPHDDGCKPNPSQTPKSILGFSSILLSPHDFLSISWFPITLHLLNVPPLDLTVDDLHSSTRCGGGSLRWGMALTLILINSWPLTLVAAFHARSRIFSRFVD
ncbi:uncharacterized protein APUU_30527S [Aspergillus puulaauensis]|uniref:Uncharacterized protein n=1 Tax=Aspergillus puulaauensis TaxID=1220207 RepID=A0A7R8AL36_9EURO|nr:uncharacterized protein APUU_30527S [Aspergillus puulaauensis]BCS22302.1 hypothetical protein APUU_30527S [Aspergillus puulaauensis]